MGRNRNNLMQNRTDRLIQLLVGLVLIVLSLLAYQGKTLISWVDRLERNTARIMYRLGIPPVCRVTLDSGVKKAHFDGLSEIK